MSPRKGNKRKVNKKRGVAKTSTPLNRKIFLSLKKKKDSIASKLKTMQKNLTKFISKNKILIIAVGICLLYVGSFAIGRVLLLHEPFRFGLVHQIILVFLSLLQIYMLYYLLDTINHLMAMMSGINTSIFFCLKNLKKRILFPVNYVWPIIPAILFARKQIIMGYVPFSAVGIYAVVLASSTFYIGLLCYLQSFLTMLAMRKISRIKIDDLPFDFPDDTLRPSEWLLCLYKLFKKGQYAFFTAGIFYTLEYVLLMPEDIVIYDTNSNSISINSSNPVGFVTGWLTIVILIIIAFPIFMKYFQNLFRQLVKNLKAKASGELRKLYGNSSNKGLDSIYSLFSLNEQMMKDGNYLINQKSIYPVAATIISMTINVIKLIEIIWPKVSNFSILIP